MLWSAIYQIILNNKIPKPNRVKRRRNKAYFNWSNSSFPHDWHWPSHRCLFPPYSEYSREFKCIFNIIWHIQGEEPILVSLSLMFNQHIICILIKFNLKLKLNLWHNIVNWQFMNLHLLLHFTFTSLMTVHEYLQSIHQNSVYIFRFYYSFSLLCVFFLFPSYVLLLSFVVVGFFLLFLFRKEQFMRNKRKKKKFKLQALTLDEGRCKNWIYMEKYFVVSLFLIKTCVNTYFVLNFLEINWLIKKCKSLFWDFYVVVLRYQQWLE